MVKSLSDQAIRCRNSSVWHGSFALHIQSIAIIKKLFCFSSTVLQQRVSAFGAIAGIFSIYNQGFYDQVLTLPISKIFFLLRFGLDDNTPAQLEVVSRALARLCYNETDEVLLDHIYENAYCHWQPTLQVLTDGDDSSDPNSVAFLQRYMALLRSNSKAVSADVDEDQSDRDSRMSMDDFQLAETDLISCLLRTNILQRIRYALTPYYFI